MAVSLKSQFSDVGELISNSPFLLERNSLTGPFKFKDKILPLLFHLLVKLLESLF